VHPLGLTKSQVGQAMQAAGTSGLTNYRGLSPELMIRRHGHPQISLTTSADVSYAIALNFSPEAEYITQSNFTGIQVRLTRNELLPI
jgi:hypothetical protein